MPHPVSATLEEGRERNRRTTLFRPILAIPDLIRRPIRGIAAAAVASISWPVVLVTGMQYEGLRHIASWAIRFHSQTGAYLGLLTDRFPEVHIEPRGVAAPYPARGIDAY